MVAQKVSVTVENCQDESQIDEWIELSPIFSGVSTGQITLVEGIEFLMQEPASYA